MVYKVSRQSGEARSDVITEKGSNHLVPECSSINIHSFFSRLPDNCSGTLGMVVWLWDSQFEKLKLVSIFDLVRNYILMRRTRLYSLQSNDYCKFLEFKVEPKVKTIHYMYSSQHKLHQFTKRRRELVSRAQATTKIKREITHQVIIPLRAKCMSIFSHKIAYFK